MKSSSSRSPAWAFGALLGAVTSLPLMALLFLGQQVAGLPFVPYDLFGWIARVLPGGLVTLFIDSLVSVIRGLQLGETSGVAKSIEQLLALATFLIGGAIIGAAIALLRQRSSWSGQRIGASVGAIVFLLTLAVELSSGLSSYLAAFWLALLLVGWGTLLGAGLEGPRLVSAGVSPPAGRRAFLLQIAGGSLGVALAAWGVGYLLEQRQEASGASQPLPQPVSTAPPAVATVVAAGPTPTAAPTPSEPAPGTRPAVTSNDKFYRIDINLGVPAIQESAWELQVLGLFDRPRPLKLSDLMAYPQVTQPVTLSCISNPVGGDLIGNARWTGLRLRDLLEDLGLKPEAKQLRIVAGDGFYETVEMADLMDPRTLLVYGMNGVSLPAEHGFPLRILIPNRYGMKQPKWIASITAIEGEGSGYWVDRGWSKEARPQIVSVIDVIARDQAAEGRVPVGGIAWAGDRGIAKVEMQIDGGAWEPALLLPPLGPLTWVQWRYDWPASPGRHSLRVRAIDGTGALQIEQSTGAHPDGATGYHSVTTGI